MNISAVFETGREKMYAVTDSSKHSEFRTTKNKCKPFRCTYCKHKIIAKMSENLKSNNSFNECQHYYIMYLRKKQFSSKKTMSSF